MPRITQGGCPAGSDETVVTRFAWGKAAPGAVARVLGITQHGCAAGSNKTVAGLFCYHSMY